MAPNGRWTISKSLTKYHPRVGYTYMPSVKIRVQGANGGYLVRTNAAGFRSDREFVDKRPPGVFRALLFGDSQSSGDGMPNALRYSDLLEAALPGLEINNYALSGTATDQQYLAYQEHASTDHDLLVIGLYVENIRRITRRVIKARDAAGDAFFRAKPYYELDGEELRLHNVPVPKLLWTEETLPKGLLPHVYSYDEANFFFRNQSKHHGTIMQVLAPLRPVRRLAKQVVTQFKKFQPVPDYNTPDTPGWLLMRAILKNWIASSKAPVLLVPLPHDSSLTGLSDPRGYQARFRELSAETGCQLYDPLPGLLKLAAHDRHTLWSDVYGHFSVRGQASIAELLGPVVQGLMAKGTQTAA